MVSIRRYKETDRPALRAFALAHAPEGFADKKGSTELYPAIYLDYYLEYEPENTLVAEDEDGTLA
ncbi:MAG: GNAT family N-acetyltransferase, partial [Clostridia bacterium]|nr:GNAT family N-acetyltransferase [Clostridia bacterium]